MHTYIHGIDAADPCLELRKAHEQNYIIFPRLAHRRVACCIWNFGDVSLDMTQRFELVYWALSISHGY